MEVKNSYFKTSNVILHLLFVIGYAENMMDFKTSNVILHLLQKKKQHLPAAFQDIKCYSSSIEEQVIRGGFKAFQDIKCYSSSHLFIIYFLIYYNTISHFFNLFLIFYQALLHFHIFLLYYQNPLTFSCFMPISLNLRLVTFFKIITITYFLIPYT